MKDNLFDIIGIKGYCIKKDGTVWCCRKKIGLSIGGTTSVLTDEWVPIKSHQDKDGYLKVVFHNRDRQVNGAIHRLLAQVFLLKPEGYEVVCHNDGDNQNNKLSNLRWATQKENIADKKKHGTQLFGSKSPNAKLVESEVGEIKSFYRNGHISQKKLGDKYGVSEHAIWSIVHGITWARVPELIPN